MPFFHWGDLDLGGLRILLHLRRTVDAAVRPVAAAPEVVRRHQRDAAPLPGRHVPLLRELSRDALALDLEPVIAAVIQAGVRVEQEAVDPRSVLDEIEEIVAAVRRGLPQS